MMCLALIPPVGAAYGCRLGSGFLHFRFEIPAQVASLVAHHDYVLPEVPRPRRPRHDRRRRR